MMMTNTPLPKAITFGKGHKKIFPTNEPNPDDRFIYVHGIPISVYEFLHWFNEYCKNEDRNYPNHLGGQKLMNCLKEVITNGEVSESLLLINRLGQIDTDCPQCPHENTQGYEEGKRKNNNPDNLDGFS